MNPFSSKPKRACLYLRTSTTEQHVENQRPVLEDLARRRGLDVVAVFEEQASAVKKRPIFEQVMADAHAGKFDVLCIWALDRMGRSMTGNLQAVLDLDRWGVQVVSLQEPWLDTSGPVRDLLVAIFSWVGAQERARLVERVKLGQERARRDGVHLGRPRVHVDLQRAVALRAGGMSVRTIAKKLKTSPATVQRALSARGVSKAPLQDGHVGR